MKYLSDICKHIVGRHWFEWFIIAVIVVNSSLIMATTYGADQTVDLIQEIILGFFTVELVVRYLASESNRAFFKSGWHLFDLFLVVTGYLPESLFPSGTCLLIFRIVRILRVLRLVRTSTELKLILAVLLRSFKTLIYNGIFFFIFFIMFARLGVSMFRIKNVPAGTEEAAESYLKEFSTLLSGDPYGSLGEAMFTLFRIMTGDDWTVLCYNLRAASEKGIIVATPAMIVGFHVCWFVLAAFLLLNLLVGAIVNNYQVIMDEVRRDKSEEERHAEAQRLLDEVRQN